MLNFMYLITLKAWQVPACGEEPEQDLLDLVHLMDWQGDDDGLVLTDGLVARPGDWIKWDSVSKDYDVIPNELMERMTSDGILVRM